MILVTKPFMPRRSEYESHLRGIWKREWLTNNGPLVNKLELDLKEYLGVRHMLYVANGTVALQIAIRALGLAGEIITTPFSFVATASSVIWEGCRPVFVDIDPGSLNIDPATIEAAITPTTSAILATHCFGNPCNIAAIEKIADRHGLKVIYDAAHCFGSRYRGKSVFEYGDVSATSFHATKVFHTIEGGAVFAADPDVLKRMSHMRNFGHDGPERFTGVGINGKNSEFHAAMGLCVLAHISEILERRRQQCLYYDHTLRKLEVRHLELNPEAEFNYAYYPIIFATEEAALGAKAALEERKIFPRRYFYPALSTLRDLAPRHTPVCEDIAARILCLPLYHDLAEEEQDMIARVLLRCQNYGAQGGHSATIKRAAA